MSLVTSFERSSLEDRVISALPLSISTSLAFESLFEPQLTPYDPARQIPNKVSVSDYQEMWINLTTLFRNLSQSIDKNIFLNSSEYQLADVIESEMDVINSLFVVEGKNLCKPLYYALSYESLHRHKFGRQIKVRPDKTDFQKLYHQKLMDTLKVLHKRQFYHQGDLDIRPENRINGLILTHIPFDLLSHRHFHRLDLLESNTGKLKPKHQWNTKYYPVGDRDLSILPFCRKLLLVLGDRVLIQPSDIRLRRLILDIAEHRNWTPMTTLDKINLDLSIDIKEPMVLQFLTNL